MDNGTDQDQPDIVARLRANLTMSQFIAPAHLYSEQRRRMREAADEIERLRAALASLGVDQKSPRE